MVIVHDSQSLHVALITAGRSRQLFYLSEFLVKNAIRRSIWESL
jgi:hypothetical protein